MPRLTRLKLVKIVGYPSFFAVLFLFFLAVNFPTEQFVSPLEAKLSNILGSKVTVGSFSLSITGGATLSNVEIDASDDESAGQPAVGNTQSPGADGKPQKKMVPRLTYLLDEVDIDVGVLSWIMGDIDVEVEVEGLGGELIVKYQGAIPEKDEKSSERKEPKQKDAKKEPASSAGKETPEDGPIEIHVEARGLSIKRIHFLRDMLSVPIGGNFSMTANIESPSGGLAKSEGKLEFSLDDVQLSRDGFEKEMFGMTMAIPALTIKSLESEMVFKDGAGTVTKFNFKSDHLAVGLEGGLALKDPIKQSKLDLYFTFKVLDEYVNKSEAIKTIMGQIDVFSSEMRRAHRDDGFYGFRCVGAPGRLRFVPSKVYAQSKKASTRKRKGKKRGIARRNKSASRAPPIRKNPNPPNSVQNIEREEEGENRPPLATSAPRPPEDMRARMEELRREREEMRPGGPPDMRVPPVKEEQVEDPAEEPTEEPAEELAEPDGVEEPDEPEQSAEGEPSDDGEGQEEKAKPDDEEQEGEQDDSEKQEKEPPPDNEEPEPSE